MRNILHRLKSAAALIMCLSLLLGMAVLPSSALAAEPWMQESLDKLVSWGVMKGYSDGLLHENDNVTRAQFVAMVNRALGYSAMGTTPFKDVPASAWYADDINIGYTAGYFTGSSKNTASPDLPLTREQAVVLLSRNLRLDEKPGEVMEFSDGTSFSTWGKSYISSAVGTGMISGYPDGTFRPQNLITRGELAKVLTNAVGSLIQTPGAQSLGGVYGNLTITTPNFTLKDTTIAGDLYLSGGVGLGSVTLENVRVLGRITVIGGGESNSGSVSVVLRNVDADSLVVDGLLNKTISLSAEGDTLIPNTSIRTNVYLQDNTPAGYGFTNISMDGEAGSTYNVAGNLKNVTNRTPGSTLIFSRGVVKKLTVDEAADGSVLKLVNNATVTELALDSATQVSGSGDVTSLNVGTAGSKVELLPDEIIIRPGVTANINGEEMDTVAAEEASSSPRILSGYPRITNLASTSLSALFKTNKKGVLYWTVSKAADSAVSLTDLLAPPVTGTAILKSGNISVTASKTEFSAKISGLSSATEYVLTAVLKDDHGWTSPVKMVSFTTPDDSVPAFASGYPYISKLEDVSAQVTVMSTKSCRLYYTLLTKGSTTPTTAELTSGKITGSFGYGSMELSKNKPESFTVNSSALKEMDSYDLYLWLTDADGAKSSPVKKLSFTTVDRTPPVFQAELAVTGVKETAVSLTGSLNEAGTVYWVAVAEGAEYPKPPVGSLEPADLTSEYSKLQVYSGMNAFKSGKTTVKANTDFTVSVAGLKKESAYDIYYLAVDTVGNYSQTIKKLTANTLDNSPPTAEQRFSRYSGNDVNVPYADTDVIITFSENIQRASTNELLLNLYKTAEESTGSEKTAARDALAKALSNTIKLYNATGSGQPSVVTARSSDGDSGWTIDYRNAKLKLEEGRLSVTFATTSDSAKDSALNLSSGGKYYFQLEDIADTSSSKNLMGVTKLPEFTTISAQVSLAKLNITSASVAGTEKIVDVAFSLTPISTSKADSDVDWDTLVWANCSVSFELLRRVKTGSTYGNWESMGETSVTTSETSFIGRSLGKDFLNLTAFPHLNSFAENTVYEYGVHFTKVSGSSARSDWTQRVDLRVSVVSGSSVDLRNLATSITDSTFASALAGGVSSIGTPKTFEPYVQFSDSHAPSFTGGYPTFSPTDCLCEMNLLLDRPGTVYYAIAPVGSIITQKDGIAPEYEAVPKNGTGEMTLTAPGYLNIVNPTYSNVNIKTGSSNLGTGVVKLTIPELLPDTKYYAYFVIKSTGQIYSSVYLYGFSTEVVTRPVITLDLNNPVVTVKSDLDSSINYMLVAYNTSSLSSLLTAPFKGVAVDPDQLTEAQRADSFTVLNAMATNVVSGLKSIGSLFDVHANQAYKDRLADYIRATTPVGSVVGNGTLSAKANVSSPVDCSKMPMSPVTQYCFLAVGRSSSGSGDAFRAIYPVSLVDSEHPKVINMFASLETDPDSGRTSGTVTLVFDEDLYYFIPGTVDTPASQQAVDNGPLTPTKARLSSFISLSSIVTSLSDFMSVVSDESAVNVTTNTMSFKLTSAPASGASVVFKPNLADKYQNVCKTSLSIGITAAKGADGKYGDPTVSIPSIWDGR